MVYSDEDEVVISGIGGKFPEAEDVCELSKKLFGGEHMVTKDERVLTKGVFENLPECNGKSQTNTVMFDNTFFGISTIVASAMDPLTCQIIERTFEAVIDAGINPSELKGTNSSVFSGTCHSDSDLEWATNSKAGYGIMGRNRCMNSNRISYWLDLNGTSVSTDCNWSGGLSNLFLGWKSIKNGFSDIAIVSAANLQCHPLITIQLKDLGLLSPDGYSRTFDDNANGTGRSSAVVVLVLQRASLARRSYATIGHVLCSCYGNRDTIINKTSKTDWETLFREFYSEAKIDLNDVHYIEADGASNREEDAEELNAINEVFCKNRKTPLLVGCVKSNLGNTEATSALCGVVKALIALERGLIPQNLHYSHPNALCPALAKGQIKVVDKNTPLPNDVWIAVNNHGFGGSYGHVILKANPIKRNLQYDGIPRLVLLSNRMDDYLAEQIKKVESVPYDPEFIGLLHEIFSRRLEKYLGRGYTILPKPENPIHEHQVYGDEKRPIWFVFSGMGSQWPKMGKRLMDLPIFRKSIEKCHKVLEPEGLDLIKIITTDDPHIFDNILHSFVGIAAIQVGLVDILRALRITPDGLIGHSVGELGCAYADGCFTAEEMVLAAYYRGRASTEVELIKGSMAAVGKGYKEMKDQLPEDVDVACHNSDDSCTLSGPVDSIHKFVSELKEKGVFAKSVNASNIAYHSRYIKPAAPKLLQYLKKVVTNPKPRSSKWISTSNPESAWDTELAKYCSAEYHTNNLLSSVLFEEGSKHIPKNAICIEIAPHGLLQAILKRSLGDKVTNIPLTSRSAEDSIIFLLQAIGKMYMVGIDPWVINLYPKIEYPVSRGTHFLHQLVHWLEQKPAVVTTPLEKKIVYSFKQRLITTAVDGTGYIVNDQNIYPISVFLDLAWDIFTAFHKKQKEECTIVFRNFKIEQETVVHLTGDDNGTIAFNFGSGYFEILTESIIASGVMYLVKESKLEFDNKKLNRKDLIGDEITMELKRKGYGVGEGFKNLKSVSLDEEEVLAEVPASVNFIQTLESMLQLHILHSDTNTNAIVFPQAIESLEISPTEHNRYKSSFIDSDNIIVEYCPILKTAQCGGIKVNGLKFRELPKVKSELEFECKNFLPFVDPPVENTLRYADFCFSVLCVNINAIKNFTDINILEVISEGESSSIGKYLQERFHDYKVKVKTMLSSAIEIKDDEVFELIITPGTFVDKCTLQLSEKGFVLAKTDSGKKQIKGFNVIGKFSAGHNHDYLFLKKQKTTVEDFEFILIEESVSALITTLRNLKVSEKNVYLVGHKEPNEGIDTFKAQMEAETVVPLRWIYILDKKAPMFDSKNSFYAEELKKDLTTNIYKNGSWGGYSMQKFSEANFKEEVNFAFESDSDLVPTHVTLIPTQDLLTLEQVEFSGKLNNKKVMGIAQVINNQKLELDKNLSWEIPESWTLEDAATVPICYSLAYTSLVIEGKLKNNEKILITDGMTCLGQAMVAVALTIAERVFVTVSNDQEAVLIKKLFPQLNETDIMCHNDPKFTVYWKLKMKQDYARVVVNTLEGERMFAVLNCCGKFGRIFHFGKEDLLKNKPLGTSLFLLYLALYARSPDVLRKLRESDKVLIQKLISDGIRSGTVKPLPRVTVSLKEFRKIETKIESYQERVKTVLLVDTIKPNMNFIKFTTTSSYLIIGDETDIWLDIVEWLITRKAENIVVGRRDNLTRSKLRIPQLKKHKNVFVHDHQNIPTLLQEVKKLGQLSVVYYISMNSAEENNVLTSLDKTLRERNTHLVVLTKRQGYVSMLCSARNAAGYPSTNFVWKADDLAILQNLEVMAKVNSQGPIIHVSSVTNLSSSDCILYDLLPSSVDEFCELGSALEEEVRISPLQTLSGIYRHASKEFTCLFFVPGLYQDPIKALQPVVSDYLYPVFCVHIPDMKLSIPQMAAFVLPSLVKVNKGNVYNLVGVSWGCHLAMELTKQLEALGAVVGLTLIQGPFLNTKSLIRKSLDTDLINIICGFSKNLSNVKVQSEILSEKTWLRKLNRTLAQLNLPPEKEMNFHRAAAFVHNHLQALLDHDTDCYNFKGPFTVLVTGQQCFDEKAIWKLSKSLSFRSFPGTKEDLLRSPQTLRIVHGSAVARSMSNNTIHMSSFFPFEEFIDQKIAKNFGDDFQGQKNKKLQEHKLSLVF